MKFKVLELKFNFESEEDAWRIFDHLENNIPNRMWRNDLCTYSWSYSKDKKNEFTITVFEEGFEDRTTILRILKELDITPTENIRYI